VLGFAGNRPDSLTEEKDELAQIKKNQKK